MYRTVVFGSGILAAVTFFAARVLDNLHSPITDFTAYLVFPFFCLVFLLSLFLVRIRRIGSGPLIRNVILGLRGMAIIGIVGLLAALFLPRSYGTLPKQKRAGVQYWDLSTGSRIAYTLISAKGPKKPYPVIYLQGGPGGTVDAGLIRIMTPIAAEGYDVYLYDQIGSGWSDRLSDIRGYSALRHKRDLEAIVQKIGGEKVILIGQSWGAMLAALYTADNSQRVASLILTGPGPIQPWHPEQVRIGAPDSLHLRNPYYTNHQGNELANNIRTRAMEMYASLFGKKLASDREADDFANYLGRLVNRSTVCDTSLITAGRSKNPDVPVETPTEASVNVPNGKEISGGAGFYVAVMTVRSFGSTPDPRPKLRNLPIPLLLMKGQCDNQPWGADKEYLDLFPNHRLVVVPDAGHGIYVEKPELYLATIKDFLKKGG